MMEYGSMSSCVLQRVLVPTPRIWCKVCIVRQQAEGLVLDDGLSILISCQCTIRTAPSMSVEHCSPSNLRDKNIVQHFQ